MLDKLKLLLGIPESDTSEDELLTLLIAQSKDFATQYCNCEYGTDMDSAIMYMTVIAYNQIGTEGATMERFTGAVEQVAQNYPDWLLASLRSFRRIRTVG